MSPDTPGPLVSFIVASYNHERYLAETLDSCLAQTYRNIEVIVVDDASTDGSRAILEAYRKRFPDVLRFEVNAINRRQAWAMRRAVELARGDFIAVTGSDDVSLPHRVAAGLDILLANPALGAVFSRIEIVDGDGRPTPSPVGDLLNAPIDNMRWRLLAGNCLCAPSALIRSELARRHRFNPIWRFVEDFDLWLRILDTHEIHRDDDIWVKYRQHGANLSIFPSGEEPLAPRYESATCIIRALQRWPVEKIFRLRSTPGTAEHARDRAQCHARLAEHCLRMDETTFGRAYLYSHEAYRQLVIASEHDPDNELAHSLMPEAWRRLGDVGRAEGGQLTTLHSWQDAGARLIGDQAAPPPGDDVLAFRAWQRKRLLQDIDGEHFARRMQTQWKTRPFFAVLIDGRNEEALTETLDSLHQQIYCDWLAVIVGGAMANSPRTISRPEATPVAQAIEAAARTGFGDWALLLPAGTKLEPIALFSLADNIDQHPQWQLVYADDAGTGGSPRFKPDFDAVLLAGTDYLGAVAVSAPVLQALATSASLSAGLGCALAWQIADALGDAAVGHVADVLSGYDASAEAASSQLLNACALAHFDRFQHQVRHVESPLAGSCWTLPVLPVDAPPVSVLSVGADDCAVMLGATRYPELRKAPAATTVAELAAAIVAAPTDLIVIVRPGLRPAAAEWLQVLVASLLGWQAAAAGPAVVGADGLLEDAGLALGIGGSLGPMLANTRYGEAGDTLGRAALPHRVAALASNCLLLSRCALATAGGLDASYASLTGCLADACLKMHRAGHTLIWTPAAVLHRVASPSPEVPETPQNFVDRWLPTLARDPFWNRNLALRDGAGLAETELVARWQADRRDVLRILALPLPPSGQAEYRVTAPMRMLDHLGLAQVTSACEPVTGKERAPTPVELQRLAPDTIYAQAAFDDVRLQGLIHAARHNPGIFRVFSLDDRVTDVPAYNASRGALPPDKVAERMRLALSASQRLVVSTEPLAELYRHDINDIRIVPNRLEKAIWDSVKMPTRPTGNKPRVGWAGAIQHRGDLAIIAPVIEALAEEVDWVFFGMIPAGCDKFIAEFHPPVKPYAAYPAELGALSLDLALAPLEINLFNEAKSNLRLLEYGFFGWPVIASDILPYQADDAPVHRVANRPEAWLEAIRERIGDPVASRAEGERLRAWVRSRYLLEDWPDDWLTALSPSNGPFVVNAKAPPPAVTVISPKGGEAPEGWNPEVRDGLPRILAYAQTTLQHDYRAASPLRALRNGKFAHTLLVGEPDSNVVSYLSASEIERLAPDVSYWHFIVDDLRLEGLKRYARDLPDLPRIYSIDDRIGSLPPSHPQAKTFSGELLDGRIREALGYCQRLIVTTQPLADLYGSLVETVHIIPNRLETALWRDIAPPANSVRQRPRVGWAGALQHHGDLAVIADTVAELAGEVDWVFFGMMPPGCDQHIREFHAGVKFRDYPAKLASLDLDIALAPLEMNLFNEAKSNLRLLDYGYLGWPVICTDILPYRTDNPPVTRVANRTAEWVAAIRAMAADRVAARRQGEELRQWVCRSYLLEEHIDEWQRALSR